MGSKEVDEFYNDLKFTASEVVHSLTVQLQNSEKVAIDIDNMDNANTDLILAAKLGKSLLEQNEELSSRYYKIVRKLEVAFI